MAVSDPSLLFLYLPDGEQWANFIAGRLNAPQCSIQCILRNISCSSHVPGIEKTFNEETHSSESGVDSNDIVKRNSNRNSDQLSRDGVELRDSGRGSDTPMNVLSSILEKVSNIRGSVIFLSPDSITTCPFPLDVSLLNPKRTVFLFLGVNIEEVRTFFREKSDFVFKCRCCVIDVDEQSICDAIIQIIEVYEDYGDGSINDDEVDEGDDDIYSVPGCPRQLNKIEKVFPQELTEKERDVYILLERAAEDDVFVVLEQILPRKIPLICICERLYMFSLPSNVSGKIVFKVECQDHCIGEETVQLMTRFDRLATILKEEVNPLSIVASALGLAADDLGEIDTALAFKLQQLAPALTFQKLFPCEDLLNNSLREDKSDTQYPSLLHFAADLNLRTFISELLRYPGMLTACLTENNEGEYPSQIAARKGYTLLEADLLQFVEVHGRDSELRLQVYTPLAGTYIRPKLLMSSLKNPDCLNERKPYYPASGLYIDMFNLKTAANTTQEPQYQQSDSDLLSPLSDTSDNVFMRSVSSKDGDFKDYIESQFLQNSLIQDVSSFDPTSTKALKMLGVREEDVTRSRSSTLNNDQIRSSQFSSGYFPTAEDACLLSKRIQVCTDEVQMYHQETKQRTLNKIISFFGKIKNKKSPSEGDSTSITSRSIKKTFSNRSDKSAKSVIESDARKKKTVDTDNQERDSGSYSDEEKEKSSSGNSKKNGKTKEFKERGKQVTRRLSQRAHAASKEFVLDAPQLPSIGTRKEIFTELTEHF